MKVKIHRRQKKLAEGPQAVKKIQRSFTDKSWEFGKCCEDSSWNHRTSTPHRSETNGIAGRAVEGVKEGTSAILLQLGLEERWWTESLNAVAICEISKTFWRTGKLLVVGDLEN